MALEGLKAAGNQAVEGVKCSVVNGTKGFFGGLLDSTLGSAKEIFRGIGHTLADIWNAPTQLVARSVTAVQALFKPEGGISVFHPFKATAHVGLGVQRAFESLNEAGRSWNDMGFNVVNTFSRGITRAVTGLTGIDLATHPDMQTAQVAMALEAIGDGEPNNEVHGFKQFFSGAVDSVMNGNGGPQLTEPLPA